jgi:renalase|tara:strand:- start:1253 stop:2233 length:981 start_codon:yes stop_codon:yes gene_type:complete
MKDFCVVGSGIAGSTIANLLAKKYSVEIFDKARGPGGRASNRRYKDNLSFDHGLQYISPKSNLFRKFILELANKKIIKEWAGNHLDFTFEKKETLPKYIGKKGNNDICKYLIKNIKSNFLSTVTNIQFKSNHWVIILNNKDKVLFKNLILTCPFPQLKKLSFKYLNKTILNLKSQMVPNITVIAAYESTKQVPISSIKFNDKIISWASNENTKKRFKSKKTLWTIQCTDQYSKKIINLFKNNKKKYQILILKKFEELTGYQVKNVSFQNIHGWKYAYSNSNTKASSSWVNKSQLGICADWFSGSKAENAWLSANFLYKQIKKNPSK